MKRRIVTTEMAEEDRAAEGSLRPQRLCEYIGLLTYIHPTSDFDNILNYICHQIQTCGYFFLWIYLLPFYTNKTIQIQNQLHFFAPRNRISCTAKKIHHSQCHDTIHNQHCHLKHSVATLITFYDFLSIVEHIFPLI